MTDHFFASRVRTPITEGDAWFEEFERAKQQPHKRRHRQRKGKHSQRCPVETATNRQYQAMMRAKNFENNAGKLCRVPTCARPRDQLATLCSLHRYRNKRYGHPLMGRVRMSRYNARMRKWCTKYAADPTFVILVDFFHQWLTEHRQPLVHLSRPSRPSRKKIIAEPPKHPCHKQARLLIEAGSDGRTIMYFVLAEWWWLRQHEQQLATRLTTAEHYELIDVRLGSAVCRAIRPGGDKTARQALSYTSRFNRARIGKHIRVEQHRLLDRVVAGLLDKYPQGYPPHKKTKCTTSAS